MRRSLLSALALAGSLAACSGSTTPTTDDPTLPAGSRVTLRFVNAEFIGPSNFYVNSVLKTQLPGAGTIDSIYLKASSVPQAIVAKYGDLVQDARSFTFPVDTPYTVVLANNPDDEPGHRQKLFVLSNTVSAPPPGQVLFRLMKLADGISCPVDVYVTTGSTDLTGLTPVATDIEQHESSTYVAIPAGPTRVIVIGTPSCVGTSDLVLRDSGTHTLSAGEAWTMLLLYNGSGPGGGETIGDLWIRDRS